MSSSTTCEEGFFLLSASGRKKYVWSRVECGGGAKDINRLLTEERKAVAVYFCRGATYYTNLREGYDELLRGILTAAWIPNTADKFRVNICVRVADTVRYEKGNYNIDRYELAGRFGQFLKDGGRAARLAGFGAAVVDAFFWFRMFLSSCSGFGVTVFPFGYLVIGLFVGILLYGLGLLMEYFYNRWYGCTPAAKITAA